MVALGSAWQVFKETGADHWSPLQDLKDIIARDQDLQELRQGLVVPAPGFRTEGWGVLCAPRCCVSGAFNVMTLRAERAHRSVEETFVFWCQCS